MSETDIEGLRRHYRAEAIKAVRAAEQRIRDEMSQSYNEKIRLHEYLATKSVCINVLSRALISEKGKIRLDGSQSQSDYRQYFLDVIKVSMEEVKMTTLYILWLKCVVKIYRGLKQEFETDSDLQGIMPRIKAICFYFALERSLSFCMSGFRE
jgi:hypothetical protein